MECSGQLDKSPILVHAHQKEEIKMEPMNRRCIENGHVVTVAIQRNRAEENEKEGRDVRYFSWHAVKTP